jgi:hypothetical protein
LVSLRSPFFPNALIRAFLLLKDAQSSLFDKEKMPSVDMYTLVLLKDAMSGYVYHFFHPSLLLSL